MGAVQLACAVADPEHVCRAIVVIVGQAVAAYEGFFVIQQQRFVGSKEAGFAQLRRAVHAAGTHKGEGFIDTVGQLAVFLCQGRVGDEVQVPLVHLVQVGKAALGKGAQQVQGGGGLVIGLQQAFRVWHAAFFIKADAVDDIASIGRQGHAVDGFVIGRARLGELPGHAPDLDHRAPCREGHDNGHLQQDLERVANLGCRKLRKTLGTITALKQKRPALSDLGKLSAQLPGFAGKYQWRVTGQALLDAQQVRRVRVVGLLLDRQGAPAVRGPDWAHRRL
ncbi:hypothetical protein PS685_02935 [Pseudomonas fluorescens]|uniref:Uncharacterized protein n=1 Tax=Pseudomonas fluorescens TaxID=294 RepID=A0A5E6Z2Y4_PSEFL|nr:hypothetical protein PS685_02935 [Pseudomonas fluorescens]